jgi:ABC-type nitrate/sulfonate/bicarbonate transport system substrate-binding protein
MLLCPLSAAATDKVRLQLKWQHQFQFAGYYAAQAQGYYQAAGIEVEIVPSQPGEDSVQMVLQGKAEFGVGSTELLLLREQGAPVVVLAVVFQHSPLSLMTLKQRGMQNIHDLVGRRIMIEPGSSELYAYLNKEGISSDKFTLLSHGFHVKDLLAGNVDAMSTYITDEPFELSRAGQEYLLYSPRAVGIDFYGDNLFTTESQLKRKPEMVKAFRETSLKGWEYAMQHPEELVELINSRYSRRHSLEHLRFEASQMVPLLQANLVEIGHMSPGRWRHIAETYAELGMMKPDFDLKGFLYDPNPPPPDLSWLYLSMGVAALVISVVSALAVYIYRINARLHQEAAESKRAETEREKLICELHNALSKVKQLSGLLPICASCKKVREDSGYWTQIESYVKDHSEAEFSHGICPECAEKLYPEFFGKEHAKEDTHRG